jgi:hypothetical protein
MDVMPVKNISSRILAFDLLRGYFLCVILLDHLFYFPSGFDFVTGKSQLYASTAEGFFLISGIILGIVRGHKLLDRPFSVAARLLLKRSVQLYLTSVVLTLVFTLIGWLFVGNPGLKIGIFPPSGNLVELVWQTLTYQYMYGWADFLRQYAIFIALSPLALWLLRRNLWYVVLLASFGVWCLFPYSPLPTPELSEPISWQLLFFGGFVAGFYWPQLLARWHQLRPVTRTRIGWTLVTIFVVTALINACIVFRIDILGSGTQALASLDARLSPSFNKDRLPLPRLLLAGMWFAALLWLFRRYEKPLLKGLGWLFFSFGANSLYVYTIEAFVVFFFHLFVMLPSGSPDWYVNLPLSLAGLGLVYLALRTRFLMKIIPR